MLTYCILYYTEQVFILLLDVLDLSGLSYKYIYIFFSWEYDYLIRSFSSSLDDDR